MGTFGGRTGQAQQGQGGSFGGRSAGTAGPEPSMWQKIFQPMYDYKDSSGKSMIYASPDESKNYTPFGTVPTAIEKPGSPDDLVRSAANAATFNLADRLSAGLSGTTVAEENALTDAARARAAGHPITDIGAVAATLPEMGLARGGGYLLGKIGLGALGRIAGYGGEGVVAGSVSRANRGEDWTPDATDFLWGAGGGTLGEILSAGHTINRARGKDPYSGKTDTFRRDRWGRPTNDPNGFSTAAEVRAAKQARFKAAEAANVKTAGSDVDAMLAALDRKMTANRATSVTAPKATKLVDRIRRETTDPLTGTSTPVDPVLLEKYGRTISTKLSKGEENTKLAQDLRREVTNTVDNTVPTTRTGTPRPDVSTDIKTGRQLSGQEARGKELSWAEKMANRKAKKNVDYEHTLEQARRDKIAPIYDKATRAREAGGTGGFSDAQYEAMKRIVEGTWGRNLGTNVMKLPMPMLLKQGLGYASGLNKVTGMRIRDLQEMLLNNTDDIDRTIMEALRRRGVAAGQVGARE